MSGPPCSTTATRSSQAANEPSPSGYHLVFWLVIASAPVPELIGRRLLAHRLVIGREQAPMFRDDRRLSRRHASFEESDGALEVVDLESHNGTWFRGERIGRKRLSPGDFVRAGSFGFVVARAPSQRRLRADDVLVGESHPFQRVLAEVEALAASDLPALVWGPPGSGRSLTCERVHARSGREGSLVWLDARTLSTDSAHAELARAVERAAGGTLVVEAIDETPESARAVTAATIAAAPRRSCRVLATATTEHALAELATRGTWTVRIPALTERRDDVPLLVEAFARRVGGLPPLTLTQLEGLMARTFPGNLTELATLIERVARTTPEMADALLGVTTERVPANAPVVLARNGEWFMADGARVDLKDSPVLAGVLRALVRAHVAGQRGLETAAVAADTWANERILPRAAKNRVYVAVSSLRRLGLRSVVVRSDAGYALEGSFVVAD